MHCFFLERDLSCGLFCIQGVLLTSLSHASCFACLFLGEHACFHRVHLITLQAYASLTPIVHIVNVQNAGKESHANITEIHEGLDLTGGDEDEDFGIFSVKFSKDGKEVVVGNNEKSIYVYDLSANKVSARIRAHKADVNAVTFADETGNVLYSGSDDSLCKVWDRRCLSGEKSAGILTGHLDGVTFIDSRGDGRYFISNCKDQRIKLWDIRKMSSVVRS
ncbi:transducin family protein / WD-40 repeat family protein [Zea mays]|uniref:Transducin family protein / WD-40 repeat family protein n=1 Tax=Zea mays TaxID=4577 RepID=A0A1D6FUQ6_MAIZE|nr:transducin family protein / WD-40 repeat family protein [Zea mays]